MWHYTVQSCLRQILAVQEIRPATAFVSATETPAVWFSTHPDWEPTATKFWQNRDGSLRSLSFWEMAERDRPARIGPTEQLLLLNWEQFKAQSGIAPSAARKLERAGLKMGSNPYQWFAYLGPVSAQFWGAVETFNLQTEAWERLKGGSR